MSAKSRFHVDTIVAMYRSGQSQYELAKVLGVSQGTIRLRLSEAGEPARKTKWDRRAKIAKAEALRLYLRGMSTVAVAREAGVTPRSIRLLVIAAGHAPRSKHIEYPPRQGEANPSWKGGRMMSRGYVLVHVGTRLYQPEHRQVMERLLGRKLKKHEIVHHMNGVRSDNRPENLALTNRHKHEHNTYVKCLQARIFELEKHHSAKPRLRVSGTSPT